MYKLLWSLKDLMWCISSLKKFGGQTLNNVHDVQNMFLEMTLCVYACLVEFYMFVFGKIHLRGPEIIYNNVWIKNVQEIILKDHPRVLEEGPKVGA